MSKQPDSKTTHKNAAARRALDEIARLWDLALSRLKALVEK
jgi:hypothetical protein